jgi:hypothetical protein
MMIQRSLRRRTATIAYYWMKDIVRRLTEVLNQIIDFVGLAPFDWSRHETIKNK